MLLHWASYRLCCSRVRHHSVRCCAHRKPAGCCVQPSNAHTSMQPDAAERPAEEIEASDLATYGNVVDLSVFLLSGDQFVAFQNTSGVNFSTLSGICRQTTTSLGACTSIATGLDPAEQYMLVGVAG